MNNFQKKWGLTRGYFKGNKQERRAREAFHFLSLLKENGVGSLIETEGNDRDSYYVLASVNSIAFRCGVRRGLMVDHATAQRKDGRRLLHVVDMYKNASQIPVKCVDRDPIVSTLRKEERGVAYTPEEEWPGNWRELCNKTFTSTPTATTPTISATPTAPTKQPPVSESESDGGLIEKGFIPAMFNGHTLSLVETIKSLHKHGLMNEAMRKEINDKIAEEMLSVDFVSIILNMKGVEA